MKHPLDFKILMKTDGSDYQLVPLYLRRRNAAKRAINTFKDHFIARLASNNSRWCMHL
jgi:hypothetical protein